MAEIEAAIFDILSNSAGVSALVSARIYPLMVPQDVALPAVQYQKISAVAEYVHEGEAAIRSRIQISALGADYKTAKAVAAAVRAALSGYRGDVAGVRILSCFLQGGLDGFGILSDIEVVQQDFTILHGE